MRAATNALPLLPLLLCPACAHGPEPIAAATAPAQEPAPAATKPAPGAVPRELAAIAAGYAAKVAASAIFVSGRTLDSVLAEELAPDAPVQALVRPFLDFAVDREQRTVTATILGQHATAVFVDGLGCTLAIGADAAALRARAMPRPAPATDPRPWPEGDAAPSASLPAGIDAEALGKAIDHAFAERAGKPLARTRAVVVVKDGKLLAERYADGYGPSMALPGWSATKTWIDALLGRRVQEGALDPAAELAVPEWRAPGDPRAALRLDDLLRMQSGLQWSEDYEAAGSDVLRMLFATGDAAAVQPQKALAAPPRTTFRYSSGTTVLLCRLLRATFADERDYLAYPRALFDRLGMRSAIVEPDAHGTFVGSSFGFATARDWARFGQFYLQDGVWNGERLLPAGWIAQSRTPTACGERGGFGRHLWLNAGEPGHPEHRAFDQLPTDVFYLSGHEGQYVVVFPTQRLVVVRLGCTKRGGFDLHGFLQQVLRACGGA